MQLIDWPALMRLLDPMVVPSRVTPGPRSIARRETDRKLARKRALRSGNPAVRAAARADR